MKGSKANYEAQMPQLVAAVRDNDSNAVKALLQNPLSIDNTKYTYYGRTPLCEACYYGFAEIATLLVDAGANVNFKTRDGETPLILSCNGYGGEASPIIVDYLLQHGANTDLYNKKCDGAVHFATMYNQIDVVKLLLQYRANVNAVGAYKRTPLHYASSAEMITLLLASGADINAKNEAGENALFELITREHDNGETALVLIKNGIDLNYKHKSYGTALHWAVFCGRKNIAAVLLQNGANLHTKDGYGETPIVKGFANGKMDVVRLLFDYGADPDACTQFGYSLLEYATEQGDATFVKAIMEKKQALLQQGNKKEKVKEGALAEAARNGNLKILQLLIEQGVDVNEPAKWGNETALMKAAYHNRLKILNYLLEKGADITRRDYRGNTALLHAAWKGNTDIVKILLDKGANVNERNNLNWNALMQACVEGHYDTAYVLLQHGSPTNEIDAEKGATALTLARHAGNEKLVQLLEKHDARERYVRVRNEGEPYFFIADCDVCAYIPHKKDLGDSEIAEHFEGLEHVYLHSSEPDRYTTATDTIKKCVHCGTYYHHEHSIDTEDAFVGGARITQYMQRYNIRNAIDVLKYVQKNDLSQELQQGYLSIIEQMLHDINTKPDNINKNHWQYYIENLTEYFLYHRSWEEFNQTLLQHLDHRVALQVADNLALIYGEIPRSEHFPAYTNYVFFTRATQEKVKSLLSLHIEDVNTCINKYLRHTDKNVQERAKSVQKTVAYYLNKKKSA